MTRLLPRATAADRGFALLLVLLCAGIVGATAGSSLCNQFRGNFTGSLQCNLEGAQEFLVFGFEPDGDPQMLRHLIHADGSYDNSLPEKAFINYLHVSAYAKAEKITVGWDVFNAELP